MKKLVAKICCLLALCTIISCVKDRDLTPSGTENMNTNNPTTPTPGPTSGNLPLVINEFMAKNTTVVCSDSTGGNYKSADWIEIFNPNSTSIDLAGYYLTDSLADSQKFQIATGNSMKTTIAPKGHLLIWCDDFSQFGALHATFKLSSSGEQIGLFTPNGTLSDTLTFGAQTQDVSYGRTQDGYAGWKFFNPATPGTANQ